MRIKTNLKREAILEKAGEVFREQGFERASMSEIAARLGGSKATLYNYFKSKEELFVAVMKLSPEVVNAFASMVAPVPANATHAEYRERLERFALMYLTMSLHPDILAMRRNMIAIGGHSDLAKICFEAGPKQNFELVAVFLERAMASGHLRTAPPRPAMQQLIKLIESELVEQSMMGIIKDVTPERIQEAAARAVDTFLRAYGPED